MTARCEVAPDEFAAATFSLPVTADATIGGFNTREEALGTLFQIVADDAQIAVARWNPIHRLVTPESNVSHEVYWSSQSLHARLKMDLDGDKLSEPSRAIIESILLTRTGVVVWNVERQAITDVMRAVNDDPGALRILARQGANDRYLVISSRLLAKELGLFYAPGGGIWLPDGRGSASIPFISIGTFRIAHTNYHTNYPCGPVEELNSKAASRNARVPVVYFYTAIKYDLASKAAVHDLRAVDPDFLRTTLQLTPEPQ